MPWNRANYPDNWEEISYIIRFVRARHRCEWCGACSGDQHPVTGSRVFLTVAHLGIAFPDGRPGDKTLLTDCRPENLAALCQRCHMNYDRADHLHIQAENRQRKQQEKRQQSRQLSLFREE